MPAGSASTSPLESYLPYLANISAVPAYPFAVTTVERWAQRATWYTLLQPQRSRCSCSKGCELLPHSLCKHYSLCWNILHTHLCCASLPPALCSNITARRAHLTTPADSSSPYFIFHGIYHRRYYTAVIYLLSDSPSRSKDLLSTTVSPRMEQSVRHSKHVIKTYLISSNDMITKEALTLAVRQLVVLPRGL